MNRFDEESVDVRLIHDPDESALAEAVRYRLAEAGVSVQLAPCELVGGEEFGERVEDIRSRSRSLVILMSRALVDNQTMLAEAGAAWALELPIFLLINGVKSADYSVFFKRFPAYKLWTGFPRLVKALEKLPERVFA